MTIYSCPKSKQRRLEVSLQRAFKGPRQVLSSDVASIPCSELGPGGLLERMNFYLDISYALNPTRNTLLNTCLRYAPDFGVPYSLLRPRWKLKPQSAIESIRTCHSNDAKARRNAFEGDHVIKKNIRPRRVWDLWSNRVVPTWMVYTEGDEDGYINALRSRGYFADSHAWLEEDQRQVVETLSMATNGQSPSLPPLV